MTTSADPLTVLEAHFKACERFEIEIPGVPGMFYAAPLTFEESLKLLHALRQTDPAKQARMHAELIAAKVVTAEGHKAFTGDKHFSAEDRIVRSCPPTAISAIIDAFQDSIEAAAIELEKKSHGPGSAS